MNIQNNRLYFGAQSAGDLIERYGSPLYVYERETLERQYKRLHAAFRDADHSIYYACKANSNVELMKIFEQLGAGIDAVSPGEIYLALHAGFTPDRILLTGTNLTRRELSYAIEKNVLVNIDNIQMLENNTDLFAGREISVRLNPDIHVGGHEYLATGHGEAKFGILYRDLPKILELVSKHGMTVAGLHQHIGSDIAVADPLLQSLDLLLEKAAGLDTVRFLDIGGGFKVNYRETDPEPDIDGIGRRIGERINAFNNETNRRLRLIVEPGKYLVSAGGFLLTTVQSVKRNNEKIIVGTDTGMNHLIRPALYQAYHEIINASKTSGQTEEVDVVGNVCESADILGENLSVTKPEPGDILCIKNAGSYGYSMASTYNAHMLPAEVLVEGDTARLIRRRQRFEDLLHLHNNE